MRVDRVDEVDRVDIHRLGEGNIFYFIEPMNINPHQHLSTSSTLSTPSTSSTPQKYTTMNEFHLWFSTGLEHIADWKGYDHILFLLALCGVYRLQDWRQLLVLVTAFTLGHSLTLALSVFNVVHVNTRWIEFLIPVTIVLTCAMNLAGLKQQSPMQPRWRYSAALFFGLIHGLGFSFLLKSLLGAEENLIPPLFAFNIGLEAGQLLIVALVLLLSAVATTFIHIKETDKNFFLSSAVFGIAFMLLLQRLPF